MSAIRNATNSDYKRLFNETCFQQIGSIFRRWKRSLLPKNCGSAHYIDPESLASNIIENDLIPRIYVETSSSSKGVRDGAYKCIVLVNSVEVYKSLGSWLDYLVKLINNRGTSIVLNKKEKASFEQILYESDWDIVRSIKLLRTKISKEFTSAVFINNMVIMVNSFNAYYKTEGKIKSYMSLQQIVLEGNRWDIKGISVDCMKMGLGLNRQRIEKERSKHLSIQRIISEEKELEDFYQWKYWVVCQERLFL